MDPEQYAKFIVDVDDNGDKIYHTCDPDKLRDISGENPGAPVINSFLCISESRFWISIIMNLANTLLTIQY